jgi:hypothetical protein
MATIPSPMTASDAQGAASAAPSLSQLADGIRAELDAIAADRRSELAHAIRAGAMLSEAKAKLPRVKWSSWLRDNFTLGRGEATKYMRLAANAKRVEHLSSIREAVRAIAKSPKRKGKRRGEPTITGTKGEAHDPAVIEWVRALTRRGLTTKQIVASSKVGEDDWPGREKGLSDGSLAECRAAIAAEDRVRAELQSRKPVRESGRRLRQLHADKRAGVRDPESDLWKMQVAIAEAVGVLERIELPDVKWSDDAQHILNELVYDLERHRAWSDRQYDAAWALMDDMSRQRKLRELRERAADPSSTQFERENASNLADKLDRKYRAQRAIEA